MEIREFCFKNLYGHISGKLNFKVGENFVVGINGCGKTTVLNFMRYLLGPSLPDLWTRYHEYAKISFKHKNHIYALTSTINKNKHEMTLSRKGKDFNPIVTSLILNPQNIVSNSQRDEMTKEYQSFRALPHEVETLQFLYELPEPVFVGLDREFQDRFVTGMQEQKRMDVGRPMRNSGLARSIESLVRDAFNSYRSEQIKLNTKLNEDILATSFSGIVRPGNIELRNTKRIDSKKIEDLEEKIVKYGDSDSGFYIETFGNKTVRTAAEKFIKSLKVVINNQSEENKIWYILNSHQFQRIESMVALFENYEHELLDKKRQVDLFVSNASKFLLDSNKKIQFDDDTGDLYFLLSKGHNNRLSISDLSSGEKQIVTLFAYFAFSSLEGQPIIVDEPELSLHVHWQTMFMKAVKDLLPASSQAIMATHSPEICGGENVNIQVMKVKK